MRMKPFGSYMEEYRKQIEVGNIQKAYKGLMEYMAWLRTHFINKYSDNFVAGSMYKGSMDVTFFTFTPKSLKSKQLSIAVVFNHEKIRFEVWLTGQNKKVREKYVEVFKGKDWEKYHHSITLEYAIMESIVVKSPDFDSLELLTRQIEPAVIKFSKSITEALL